jgi:hypothetical protein
MTQPKPTKYFTVHEIFDREIMTLDEEQIARAQRALELLRAFDLTLVEAITVGSYLISKSMDSFRATLAAFHTARGEPFRWTAKDIAFIEQIIEQLAFTHMREFPAEQLLAELSKTAARHD